MQEQKEHAEPAKVTGIQDYKHAYRKRKSSCREFKVENEVNTIANIWENKDCVTIDF